MPLVYKAPDHLIETPQQVEHKRIRKMLKISAVIVSFCAFMVLIDMYVLQIFVVNGISMQPTLHTGQLLVVWKLPQTWASITGQQYVPKRYNLIVINDHNSANEQLVKRVIGLPGDTVVIDNNLRIYNTANRNGFNPNAQPFARHLLNPVGTFYTTVDPGQVFLMGDNRLPAASIDSRSSLGNISTKDIIGQVVFRFYPLDKITLF